METKQTEDRVKFLMRLNREDKRLIKTHASRHSISINKLLNRLIQPIIRIEQELEENKEANATKQKASH